MDTLYVLQLENGKYYVGKTADVKRRVEQHENGRGSSWTREYTPIRIKETRPLTGQFDENNLTKEYMKNYGVDNVRGGSYTSVTLTPEQKVVLNQELNAAKDTCYTCGQKGHFANRCPKKKEKEEVVWACDQCDREFSTEFGCKVHMRSCKPPTPPRNQRSNGKPKSGSCYRCGRTGHYSPDCYASSHVKGYTLD